MFRLFPINYLAAALCCFSYISSLCSQTSFPYFYNYTTEDGLSHNKVNDVIQDQYGLIWIATTNGLNRFDGYHFTNFFHDPEDSLSLSSNTITVIYEDKKANLWIGTADGGLNRFDRAKGHFIRFPSDIDGLEHITDIKETEEGGLLIGTLSAGLYYFFPKQGKIFQKYWPEKSMEASFKAIDGINRILPGQHNAWWIGGGSNLFRIIPENHNNKSAGHFLMDRYFQETTHINALFPTKDRKDMDCHYQGPLLLGCY